MKPPRTCPHNLPCRHRWPDPMSGMGRKRGTQWQRQGHGERLVPTGLSQPWLGAGAGLSHKSELQSPKLRRCQGAVCLQGLRGCSRGGVNTPESFWRLVGCDSPHLAPPGCWGLISGAAVGLRRGAKAGEGWSNIGPPRWRKDRASMCPVFGKMELGCQKVSPSYRMSESQTAVALISLDSVPLLACPRGSTNT